MIIGMSTIENTAPSVESIPWQTFANCRGEAPSFMFPDRDDLQGIEEAKQVCTFCPVKSTCLDEALARNEIHGIWGGMDEDERRRYRRRLMRRQRIARAQPAPVAVQLAVSR